MRLQDLASRVRSSVRTKYSSLLEAFAAFDTDGDSWLSYRELQTAIHGLGLDIQADDAVELILQADRNADGFLDYGYVLCACVPVCLCCLLLLLCAVCVECWMYMELML